MRKSEALGRIYLLLSGEREREEGTVEQIDTDVKLMLKPNLHCLLFLHSQRKEGAQFILVRWPFPVFHYQRVLFIFFLKSLCDL